MNLNDKQKEIYQDTIFLKENYELLNEARGITIDKYNMCIVVTPDENRNFKNMEYFKIVDSKDFTRADKIARITFRNPPEYINHSDNKKPWILNKKERKILNAFIRKVNPKTGKIYWVEMIEEFNRAIANYIQRTKDYDGLPLDLEIPNYDKDLY